MMDLKTFLILTTLSASFGIAASDFLTNVYGKLFGEQLPKPFGCSFCMAFWGGVIYSLYLGNGFVDSFMIGCASSVMSAFMYKFMNV
jgi:hypothetical protein